MFDRTSFPRVAGVVLVAGAVTAAAQTAPPPATEIYLAPIRLGPVAPTMGPARVASENPKGYDNQPYFGSDGRTMLFTSNRDGKQTDIYFLELQTRQIRRFTETPESEYSPTVMPDEAGVSAIRVEADGTQRVWQFGGDGAAVAPLLPDVKPVGYHAWIAAGRLAVFVLGKPATLEIADVATGKSRVVARDIGRAVLRRPSGAISFMQREGEGWIVKEWLPATDEIRTIAPALPGSAERDAAWAPDGTLFMTKGGEVHWWRPGQEGWTLLSDPGIGALTRLTVSPDGRWLALVATEPRP
ncbi:MAG TPA: hypothetical protein VMW48_05755 [Vicinamibacterales bacterium]|nr:hypothetical protein [Vicinamibacterales bacterium]